MGPIYCKTSSFAPSSTKGQPLQKANQSNGDIFRATNIISSQNSQPLQNQNNNCAISNADKGAIFLAKRCLNWDIFYQNSADYSYNHYYLLP
jgi:hypothetical protein